MHVSIYIQLTISLPEESGDAFLATVSAILDGVSKQSNAEESIFSCVTV